VLAPSPYYDPKIFNAELDPSFAKEYEGRFSESIDFDKDLCGYLSEKAAEELDAYELQLNAGANVPLAEDKREIQEIQLALKTDKLKAGKLILSHEKCIACHDPGVGKPVGPYFPFRDERKFAEANRKEAGFDLSIVEKVERMISSETHFERRMPLNRPALSAEEREAIVAYLKSIAVPPNPAATSQKAKKRH
jgi:mono/diheme cytochrome c family protein